MTLEQNNQSDIDLPKGYSWGEKTGRDGRPEVTLIDPKGKEVGTVTINLTNFTKREKWSFKNHRHPIGIGNFDSIDQAREALVEDMFEN